MKGGEQMDLKLKIEELEQRIAPSVTVDVSGITGDKNHVNANGNNHVNVNGNHINANNLV